MSASQTTVVKSGLLWQSAHWKQENGCGARVVMMTSVVDGMLVIVTTSFSAIVIWLSTTSAAKLSGTTPGTCAIPL